MRIFIVLALLLTPITSFAHSNEEFLDTVDVVRKSIVVVEVSQDPPTLSGMTPGSLLDNYLKKNKPEKTGLGTGFIINGKVPSKHKYIITNNHVIDGAKKIKIYFEEDSTPHIATLVGTDPLSDIAVLKIDEKVLESVEPMSWGDSNKLRPGQEVWAIGHPQGLAWTVSKGVVSHKKRRISNGWQTVVQSDVSINQGNSGGPLMTMDGKIVAINTFILSKSGGSIGLSMSVDSENAQYVVAKLIENGRIDRPRMGTHLHYDPETQQVSIDKVEEGSAAEEAGIEPKDVILAADGKEIHQVNDLFDILQYKSPYEDMAITLLREGTTIELTITLGLLGKEEAKEQADELSNPKTVPKSD